MKKKILFMTINMNVGGTEKALLNMIAELPLDQFEITVLLLEKSGGFMEYIPEGVNVEHLNGYGKLEKILNNPPKVTALEFLTKGRVIKASIILLLHLLSKVTGDRTIFFKYVLKDWPPADNSYDAAVAYAGPMEFITYYVLHKIKARKKVQWVHFDITKTFFNKYFARRTFTKFDKVFVVSNEGKKKLIDTIPVLKDKTDVFFNIMSSEAVNKMAAEGPGFKDNFNGVRILTIGRLCKEKGQDLIIPVLARLKKAGYSVKWYCIGDGSQRSEYEQLIKKYDVENDFVLLGTNPNPYPFLKQADIYVQPSRHEGYCITLAEARCLHRPIVTTNFTGAAEQITNQKTGLIASPDENDIYDVLTKLIDNQDLQAMFTENLFKEKFDNGAEMEKLYSLL